MIPYHKKSFLSGTLVTVVVLGILFSGCEKKIEPGTYKADSTPPSTPGKTATARLQEITEWYEAVGTVRPRTETRIEARVTGQVLDVKVNPGDLVSKGSLLVSLDSRQMRSQQEQAKQALKTAEAGKEQAKQAVVAARAAFNQAELAYKRIQTYFQSQAATAQELEKAESVFLQAKAGLTRAKEGLSASEAGVRQAEAIVRESTIALGYTKIIAPEDGVVLKRFVEAGDLALPGKPLIALRTSGALRLEAFVREGLITKITPGSDLMVDIGTLNKKVSARVEELVPYADPNSRTFLVKALIPQVQGLYPGMFGKLLIPVRKHGVITIPGEAIRRVGQLELIRVNLDDRWQTRFVKTGALLDDEVEILSGLKEGEIVGWEESDNG